MISSALALKDREIAAEYPSLHRILLIEDNQSDVYLIKKLLRDSSSRKPFAFHDVPRMVDALELLDRERFDLILLDLGLLDIDGSAAVAALRTTARDIPIIVHSGASDRRLKEEALMCGARHFLVKGCESPFAMRFMIEQTLGHA